MRSSILVLLITLIIPVFNLAQAQPQKMSPFNKSDQGLLFTVQGSNTVGAHLAPNWAKDYLFAKGVTDPTILITEIENEYRVVGTTKFGQAVYINIAAHGSSTGFVGMIKGNADIAMASRAIKGSEAEALANFGDMRSFDAEHVVAIDGLAIIVNKNNSVDALTVETIAKIFSGEINNWRSISGKNLPIHIYARDNNSGTWDTFSSLVLQKAYTLSSGALRFESNDQLSDRVAMDDGGIGFVGLASVRQAKMLAVSDGDSRPLKPRPLYVATEDYPLSRRLFMYVAPEQHNRLVSEFLDFAQSDTGQERVENIGFISQKLFSVPADPSRSAPEDYLEITRHAERLSVNFRFGEGSAELDNKARRDLLRLTNYLRRSENEKKRIQLIGFGDQKNARSRELILSNMRALMVQTALYKQGIPSESVLGFGSWLPVAAMQAGNKIKNRRVEIWLYDPDVHDLVVEAKRKAELKAEKAISESYSYSGLTAFP